MTSARVAASNSSWLIPDRTRSAAVASSSRIRARWSSVSSTTPKCVSAKRAGLRLSIAANVCVPALEVDVRRRRGGEDVAAGDDPDADGVACVQRAVVA